MMTPYSNTPDYPFPPQMHGTFCRMDLEDGSRTCWLLVDHRPCTHDSIVQLKKTGAFENSDIAHWLAGLRKPPRNNLFWLYRLEKFVVDAPHNGNRASLSANKTEQEEVYFDDFNKMMDFCAEHYRASLELFKKDYEVDYPQA